MPRKIRKRSNGKYTLTVYDGYDGNGKQVIRSKTVQASSMKDVRRLYAEFENEVRSGRVVSTAGYKLQEFAETWLKEYCEKNLAPKTVETYRKQLKARIIPAFGSRRLAEITPLDVIYFVNRLKTKPSGGGKNRKPASDHLVSQCFYVLSSLLQDATEWQLIGSNPCASVPRPKVQRTKMKLPDMDGMQIITKVRSWTQLPIIVVSARGDEPDKVAALEAGADDYITKPFGAAELLARIRVAIRHTRNSSGALSESGRFIVGDLTVDYDKHQVLISGENAKLTQNEYRIVALLSRHAGKVLTYDYIMKELWGPQTGGGNQILRVNMANIRRKIEKNPAEPQYIFTEVGVGYRMAEGE